MGHQRYSSKRGGLTASVAAVALVLTGVPTAGFALDAFGQGGLSLANGDFSFTPASVDPKLARFVAERATGTARMMRFTPAGVAERSKRSLTVAVRVGDDSAQAIQVRSAIATAQDQMSGASGVRIVSARYNLGLARGYQSFAKAAPAAASPVSRTLSDAAIPDLATYRPAPGVREDPSRFTPRNAASEPRAAAAPRALDTSDAGTDQPVDFAGSYRLTRHIDVTAGVRYQSERDRLAPVADTAKQDNQAVYVGTQFRF